MRPRTTWVLKRETVKRLLRKKGFNQARLLAVIAQRYSEAKTNEPITANIDFEPLSKELLSKALGSQHRPLPLFKIRAIALALKVDPSEIAHEIDPYRDQGDARRAANLLASSHVAETSGFVVEQPTDGAVLTDDDVPVVAKGSFRQTGNGNIYVILQDRWGHYYLQYPKVTLLANARWRHDNIIPGDGNIVLIRFGMVDDEGTRFFEERARRHLWGAFDELPDDWEPLADISIHRR